MFSIEQHLKKGFGVEAFGFDCTKHTKKKCISKRFCLLSVAGGHEYVYISFFLPAGGTPVPCRIIVTYVLPLEYLETISGMYSYW